MNYLAHLLLSSHSHDALAGALLGDFVKGRVDGRYSPAVTDAILLHRAIDRFTDTHVLTRASRALISPQRRRFAGILVDVFYDHFLARHWRRYHPLAIDAWTATVYAALLPQRATFPPRLQRILPLMAADDWLGAYAEPEAVDAALRGIARRFHRFPRAAVLADAAIELEMNYLPLERHFLEFFPELQTFASGWRSAPPTETPLPTRSAA
jgi:acyl carrier protein phosphodiesterase